MVVDMNATRLGRSKDAGLCFIDTVQIKKFDKTRRRS